MLSRSNFPIEGIVQAFVARQSAPSVKVDTFSRRDLFRLLPLVLVFLLFGRLPKVDRWVREELIARRLKTLEGRRKLAQAMAFPLRYRRDYVGIARKTFLIEQMPEGALPVYDRDPEVTRLI